MSDNFQQTVDLRGKMERQKKAVVAKGRDAMHCVSTTPLEKIYQDEGAVKPRTDLKTISRPKTKEPRQGLIRLVVFILAILVVGATVYSLFFRSKGAAVNPKTKDWYAIKLVDGEIFYGQVFDVKADPVVIDNVYYDYDQAREAKAAKDQASTAKETGLSAQAGNLRLVKRGKETHGPAGSMNVVRAQVLYLEALKSDSKVLKAILEYEK